MRLDFEKSAIRLQTESKLSQLSSVYHVCQNRLESNDQDMFFSYPDRF